MRISDWSSDVCSSDLVGTSLVCPADRESTAAGTRPGLAAGRAPWPGLAFSANPFHPIFRTRSFPRGLAAMIYLAFHQAMRKSTHAGPVFSESLLLPACKPRHQVGLWCIGGGSCWDK